MPLIICKSSKKKTTNFLKNKILRREMDILIEKALQLAKEYHKGQIIKSLGAGSYYEKHLLPVMYIVRDAGFPEVAQAVAVLHDILEDTPMTVWKLRREMGNEVTEKVKKLTENKRLLKEERTTKYMQKVMTDDDVIAVSLADQINNSWRCLHEPPTVEKYATAKWMATQIRKYTRMINLFRNYPLSDQHRVLYGMLEKNVNDLYKKYGSWIAAEEKKAA